MEQVISLREFINILLKGKWFILLITGIVAIFSVIHSFFIAIPIYEASITLIVSEKEYLAHYSQLIKIPEVEQKAIEQLNLHDISYEEFNSKIRYEIIRDANILKIYVKDEDPVLASHIANTLANNFIDYIKEHSLEQKIFSYKFEIDTLQTEITIKDNVLSKLQQQLQSTPMYKEVEKTLIQEPFLHGIVTELSDLPAAQTGMIHYTEQVINPVYSILEENIVDIQVEIEKLKSRISELQKQIDEQSIAIEESVIFFSKAIPPSSPISPNKTLNIAIAIVLGLLIGTGIVLFRYYWVSSKSVAKKIGNSNTTSNITL